MGFCDFRNTARQTAKSIRINRDTINIFLKDFPKSLVINVLIPKVGIVNPPIITAIILAIGISINAGKKIIACAFVGKMSMIEVIIKIELSFIS